MGQPDTVLGAAGSGDPGTVIVRLDNPQNVAQETHLAGLPDGIPLAGSHWAVFKPSIPTINLADDGDAPARVPETSTPIKTTPESGKHPSKKKLNISKIQATHLLFDMWDLQEKAWSSVESESQVEVPNRISGKGHSSSKELPPGLPATLPDRPGNDRVPAEPTDPTPEAPRRDNKCPHDDVDEITEVPNEDIPAGPPKKKKKKNKDSRDAVPARKGEDDAAGPSTSMAEPEDVADEATPVTASTEVPAEETKTSKKKKKHKKSADLEKFRLEQCEAKAKEMSKVKHRKLQCEQDFRAVRTY